MKKLILTVLVSSCFALITQAQVSYTYLFYSAPFNSSPSGGPVLHTIDSTTTPVTITIPASTCPDTPTVNLTHFEHNAGFEAQAFFTGTYSIEMIFKFDELAGYNRIIDFSNSTSDFGIYTLSTCLNFYPTGNIGICPGAFDTSNYTQLVITRDDISKNMKVYINDSLFTTYSDAANHYVIGAAPNDSIKFFKDDNVVPYETSSGYVALIRMADHELSHGAIDTSYYNFCHRITGVEEVAVSENFKVYPNPNNGLFSVVLKNTSTVSEIEVFNELGNRVLYTHLNSGLTEINLSKEAKGMYFMKALSGEKQYIQKIIVQ